MSRAPLLQESYAEPLDLLLAEVRRQNVALEAVALAPLVARYLDYMQQAARARQPLAIDWILLAATLIQWKSRALLAPEGDPAADPIRDELVDQLRTHRQDASADLSRRRAGEIGQLSRDGDPAFLGEPSPEEPLEPAFLSVWDLAEQARELARWAAQHRLERQRLQPFQDTEFPDVPIASMIDYLLARFAADGPELNASRLLVQQPDLPHQVSLFLALLEMAKSRQLRIRQHKEFDDIGLTLQLAE